LRTLRKQIEILRDLDRQIERELHRYYGHQQRALLLREISSELKTCSFLQGKNDELIHLRNIVKSGGDFRQLLCIYKNLLLSKT
jgi:hypothetical protein